MSTDTDCPHFLFSLFILVISCPKISNMTFVDLRHCAFCLSVQASRWLSMQRWDFRGWFSFAPPPTALLAGKIDTGHGAGEEQMFVQGRGEAHILLLFTALLCSGSTYGHLSLHSFKVLLCETDTRPMFSPGLASMAKQNRNTNQQITHSRSHQDCCHSCQRICWKGTNKKC